MEPQKEEPLVLSVGLLEQLRSLPERLIKHHGGGLIFLIGREGGGKSDLLKVLVEAAPELVLPIFFSTALETHLGTLEAKFKKSGKKKETEPAQMEVWVKEARALMSQRKKNLNPHLITVALRNALQAGLGNVVNGHPGKLVIVDGFPRTDKQPGTVVSIFNDFFPTQPAMLVEADCVAETALQRALERGKKTDTRGNITAAHHEYDKVMPGIRAAMAAYSDHLLIDSNTTRLDKVENFVTALEGYLVMAAGGTFKTVNEAPVAPAPIIAPGATPLKVVPFTAPVEVVRRKA